MQSRASATENNFDFLRLAAAYFVLVSHQFALTGRAQPGIGSFQTLGGLGVAIFFSISGYLIAQSWERDPSIWRFLVKRVLRLWPALIVATLLAALVLGPLVSTYPLERYFSDQKLWSFIFLNLKLTVRYELPGVFTANPLPNAVYGSLWTLPVEFRCYLMLMLLGVIGLVRRPIVLLCGAGIFAAVIFVIQDAQHNAARNLNLEYETFFFYAACLHYCRKLWQEHAALTASSLAIAAAVAYALGWEYLAMFLVLPPLVIFLGSASTPFIRRAGRFGDMSYGIYIYAFPVQQTVVFLSRNHLSFWSSLTISTIVTCMLAFLSWRLIENPSLGLKRYLTERIGIRQVDEGKNSCNELLQP